MTEHVHSVEYDLGIHSSLNQNQTEGKNFTTFRLAINKIKAKQ